MTDPVLDTEEFVDAREPSQAEADHVTGAVRAPLADRIAAAKDHARGLADLCFRTAAIAIGARSHVRAVVAFDVAAGSGERTTNHGPSPSAKLGGEHQMCPTLEATPAPAAATGIADASNRASGCSPPREVRVAIVQATHDLAATDLRISRV